MKVVREVFHVEGIMYYIYLKSATTILIKLIHYKETPHVVLNLLTSFHTFVFRVRKEEKREAC